MLETNNNTQDFKAARKKKLALKLDEVGWGLFFIWIAVAFLADVGWGMGFLGVGVIILGTMVTREYLFDSTCSKPTNENC